MTYKIINLIKNVLGVNKKTKENLEKIETICGKKRAVCIGINDYYGTQNDLKGCLNDVEEWSNLLENTYGFDEVSTVYNENAIRENVKIVLNEVIAKSEPNDILVIQYSGHGSYTADLNGDEDDGKDEALVLYDGLLIDDEIQTILGQIKNGVKTTIIFDSCFSGTSTRLFQNDNVYRVARFNPPKNEIKMSRLKVVGRAFQSIAEEDMQEILITGCNDKETASDAWFDGKFYGAMSFYATSILKETPFITYVEFYNKLREKLPSGMYPQTPCLEGKLENKNRIMFS